MPSHQSPFLFPLKTQQKDRPIPRQPLSLISYLSYLLSLLSLYALIPSPTPTTKGALGARFPAPVRRRAAVSGGAVRDGDRGAEAEHRLCPPASTLPVPIQGSRGATAIAGLTAPQRLPTSTFPRPGSPKLRRTAPGSHHTFKTPTSPKAAPFSAPTYLRAKSPTAPATPGSCPHP